MNAPSLFLPYAKRRLFGSIICFPLHFYPQKEPVIKGNNLLPALELIFFLKGSPDFVIQGNKTGKSQKLLPSIKKNIWDQTWKCSHLDPVALRMPKTPQSFGHSECNRVNTVCVKFGCRNLV